ncbi:DUF3080 family protein [Motiliproteus sediminis]|uniref:DUF3080 family protein n=1 Tax=Motiliproteus sediminis TaxID=1468178 RepID=UPI001AF026D7|nr:DUF3080 family protein [Motiliproteus sediminis]
MAYKAALTMLVVLLGGCSRDTPEAVLANYVDRVASVLEQPYPDAAEADLTVLPTRRTRRLPLVELRAGLLDALDLADCGLLPLISERNSILGKVKQPSVLLDYEFRFYAVLERCYLRDRQHPLHDAEFSRFLEEVYLGKQRNLYPTWWNAVFTSSELEHNLSLSKPPIALAGNPGYGDSLRALQTLLQYRQTAASAAAGQPFSTPHETDLERHYFALYGSEYGGQLNSSLRLLINHLNRVSALLDTAISPRRLCLSGRPIPKANHLRNVLDQFYAAEVQPYMALIQRQGLPWLTHMDQLAVGHPPWSPSPLEEYRRQMLSPTHPDSLWQRYQRAIKRHTDRWQTVLRQCGLMPTGPD